MHAKSISCKCKREEFRVYPRKMQGEGAKNSGSIREKCRVKARRIQGVYFQGAGVLLSYPQLGGLRMKREEFRVKTGRFIVLQAHTIHRAGDAGTRRVESAKNSG